MAKRSGAMLSESHSRTLIQYLMLKRILPYPQFTSILERIAGKLSIHEDELFASLNEKISPFSQSVARVNCEVTGQKNVVMISTADPTELRSHFNVDEVTYFYHLVENIVLNGGVITTTVALEMGSRVTHGKLTMSEAERVLERFVAKELLISDAGNIYLSALAIAELRSHVVENYAVFPCILCQQIVVYGGKCDGCSSSFHNVCCDDFKKRCKKTPKCPTCKRAW